MPRRVGSFPSPQRIADSEPQRSAKRDLVHSLFALQLAELPVLQSSLETLFAHLPQLSSSGLIFTPFSSTGEMALHGVIRGKRVLAYDPSPMLTTLAEGLIHPVQLDTLLFGLSTVNTNRPISLSHYRGALERVMTPAAYREFVTIRNFISQSSEDEALFTTRVLAFILYEALRLGSASKDSASRDSSPQPLRSLVPQLISQAARAVEDHLHHSLEQASAGSLLISGPPSSLRSIVPDCVEASVCIPPLVAAERPALLEEIAELIISEQLGTNPSRTPFPRFPSPAWTALLKAVGEETLRLSRVGSLLFVFSGTVDGGPKTNTRVEADRVIRPALLGLRAHGKKFVCEDVLPVRNITKLQRIKAENSYVIRDKLLVFRISRTGERRFV